MIRFLRTLPPSYPSSEATSARSSVTKKLICVSHLREHFHFEAAVRADVEDDVQLRENVLLAVLEFNLRLVQSVDDPCLTIVVPPEAKTHLNKLRKLDGGAMNGLMRGKNCLRDKTVWDRAIEFVRKPLPEEPGYKADCWSTLDLRPEFAGQPKDGAALIISYMGNVYSSACRLPFEPQSWSLQGGCRHVAALGCAEHISGSYAFVRSEAGSIKVISSNTLSRRGEVWEVTSSDLCQQCGLADPPQSQYECTTWSQQ